MRARIGALAGMSEQWAERVRRWHELTGGMDDPNEEYLVWQTLVGAWPIVPARLERYLEKALREAKRNTNWIEPNEAARARVQGVRALAVREPGVPRRLRAVRRSEVARAGEHASLGALLLRLTSPGLPDIYQGDAFWSLNLVDPGQPPPGRLARGATRRARRATPTRETMKFHLLRRVLHLRAEHPEAFFGSYEPLDLGPGPRRLRARRADPRRRPACGRTTPCESETDLLPEFPQELSLVR